MSSGRDNAPYLVLLTGGIASGKTFTSDYLQQKGAVIIDTDIISRLMTDRNNLAGRETMAEIESRFGRELLTAEGDLDRAKMRTLIFSDAVAKKDLEQILHGRILSEVKRQIASIDSSQYGVVVVPLIHEHSPYLQLCDEVLVIEVPYELQLQRLISRDNISEEMAKKIISSQISRLDRRKLGNIIIVSQNREFVERQLDKLHDSYLNAQLLNTVQ